MPEHKKGKKRAASATYGSKQVKNNLGKLVKQVVSQIDEKKFKVFPVSSTDAGAGPGSASVGNGWTFWPLLVNYNATPDSGFGLVKGAGASERIGNRVKLQGIDVYVNLQFSSTISNVPAYGAFCRMVILHDKRSNGSTAISGANVFTSNNIFGFPNPVFEERYTITQDSIHQMMLTSSTTGGPEGMFKFHIPYQSILEFNGDNGNLSTIVGSNYWIGIVSDDADCCTCRIASMVHYTDA